MKIKISDLKPNPFKKNINGGKLNEEIIQKIKSNIKELGLMGSLPIFKKDGEYFLIAGHHRLQALKETFGKNFEVECTLHNYSDENVLRGMVIENLTQRNDELVEVTENLNAVRDWLKNINRSSAEQMKSNREDGRGGRIDEAGSVRDISSWLNKNGEVMSIGKISEYLKVYDNLDRRLLNKTTNQSSGEVEEKISIEEAKTLARLDKKEQHLMRNILEETGLDYKQKSKLVTNYLNSPEEVKEQIKKRVVGLNDINLAITQHNLNEKKKGNIVVQETSKKIDNLIYGLSFSILDSEKSLKNVIRDISILSKYYKDMDDKQKSRISMKLTSLSKLLESLSKLINEIDKRI